MPKVVIRVNVFEDEHGWREDASAEAEVKMANIDDLLKLPWEQISAGLVEQAFINKDKPSDDDED